MKKNRMIRLCAAACAALGVLLLPVAGMSIEVQAAEIIATVQGKVMEGTTSQLLLLDTSDGKMEIIMVLLMRIAATNRATAPMPPNIA